MRKLTIVLLACLAVTTAGAQGWQTVFIDEFDRETVGMAPSKWYDWEYDGEPLDSHSVIVRCPDGSLGMQPVSDNYEYTRPCDVKTTKRLRLEMLLWLEDAGANNSGMDYYIVFKDKNGKPVGSSLDHVKLQVINRKVMVDVGYNSPRFSTNERGTFPCKFGAWNRVVLESDFTGRYDSECNCKLATVTVDLNDERILTIDDIEAHTPPYSPSFQASGRRGTKGKPAIGFVKISSR